MFYEKKLTYKGEQPSVIWIKIEEPLTSKTRSKVTKQSFIKSSNQSLRTVKDHILEVAETAELG